MKYRSLTQTCRLAQAFSKFLSKVHLFFELNLKISSCIVIGQRPTLKFIQLYTSPTYQDFHSLLIRPEINSLKSDDEKHRISPIVSQSYKLCLLTHEYDLSFLQICQGVCDGGQIVWASTLILEGLIGRKELPLNTAVGMPICSIGDDLGIMVLFSVEQIAITPNSIEFLGCLSRAASENIAGFIAPSLTTPVSPANVEQFIGIWDIYELIKKYSSDISFHILPMAPLQSFFDYQETMTFRDLCSDMDTSVENMQEKESKKLHVADFTEFQQKSDTNSYDFSGPDLLIPGGKSFRMGFSKGASMNDAVFDDDNGPYFGNYLGSECSHDSQSNEKIYTIDSRDSYRKSPTRFHEFMIALLGMTIFDVAELWMMSERTQELHVVAALHRDGLMQKWTSVGRNLKLRRGEDIPGQVLETSQPFWDNRYDKKTMNDASKYPRSALAAEIGVKTALGIPLPGFKGTCGALTLYSRSEVDVEPLIANFVTKAIQLISAGSIESKTLSRIDIENLVYSPKNLVSDILNGKLSGPRIVFDEDSNPPFFYKVQMMGSLARPDPAPSMLSIKDASPRNYNSGKRKIHAPDENYWSNSLLEAAESYFTESTTTQHSRSSVEVNGNKDTKDMRKSKKVKVIISNDTESIVGPSTNETVHNADMKMKFDIPNVSRANVIDAEIPNNSSITSGTRRCQHEGIL